VALGDFLGNGLKQAIFVDAGSGSNDTFLYNINFNSALKIIGFTKFSTLPGPVMTDSHDIRARPVDFDKDGKLDVVVFSYRYGLTSETEPRSEVQFLKNMGGGHIPILQAWVMRQYSETSTGMDGLICFSVGQIGLATISTKAQHYYFNKPMARLKKVLKQSCHKPLTLAVGRLS
jgi:hypothetical protein